MRDEDNDNSSPDAFCFSPETARKVWHLDFGAHPEIIGSEFANNRCCARGIARRASNMTTYNAENERAKRQYFTFQREAKQRSEASIDAIAKALNRFEDRAALVDRV
jgi:hypothetical protein